MSNPCFTTYKVVGKQSDVECLHGILLRLETQSDSEIGRTTLESLVEAIGGKPDEVECNGFVTDFSLDENEVLFIDTQTPWQEMSEVRHFIERQFEGMKIFYFENACEDDVLNTNDIEGRFFKTRVFIDSEDYFGKEDNYGHFETFEEAAKAVAKIVGHEVESDGQAIESALEDYLEENPDVWFSYHEVKLLDD